MVYPQRYSRRRNHRFERPELIVTMHGMKRRSANWSLSGLAVTCDPQEIGNWQPDMTVNGTLGQETDPARHDFEARVVRVDPTRRTVALEFAKLSKGAVLMFIDEFRDMIGGAA